MSGHSKWHTIKHKKGAADAKRGKVFTRIIKELTVAARAGGGDPDSNPRLRTIIADAKAVNMPAENIKRAIRRGTGEEPGVSYEEFTYEGYGPGGAAIIIDTVTDNRNRTVGELRHLLSKHGGNLAETGAVGWMFAKKGYIVVAKSKIDEEKLMTAALEAGADDLRDDGDSWEVLTAPDVFHAVADAVKALGIEPDAAEVTMLPQNYVKLEGRTADQMVRLMGVLDEHDDVNKVYSNFDIEEKDIEASLA
jgi:YebC/PmpR family DNA-binding regulatory protein